MNHRGIFGFSGIIMMLILLVTGCSGDQSRQTPPSSTTEVPARYKKGMINHPLSRVRKPEPYPIQPMRGYASQFAIENMPAGRIRRFDDRVNQLKIIRDSFPDLDLNEPVSRTFLMFHLDSAPFPSMITLSHERYFHIGFENDIFNYTDRFFTNGISLALILPLLQGNPVTRLSIPYWKTGLNYYGLRLVQNIYTPSTTLKGGILVGDRPYAGILFVGNNKTTLDSTSGIRLSSEIQIGVIGPASLGGDLQISFHNSVPTNDEPQGWQYQIRNDLLLNIMASVEKRMVTSPNADINLRASGSLGTVFTYITGGLWFRTGWFQPYFSSLGFSTRRINIEKHRRNFQCYIFLGTDGKLVGYDATLQGGIFNRTSPYTLSGAEINRLVFMGSGGLIISYGGVQLKGEQLMLSPEYQGGMWHRWVNIGLSFSF